MLSGAVAYLRASPRLHCPAAGQVFACNTDATYITAVKALRRELPRPYILSTAAFSVGAYGQGAFLKSKPGSDYTGVAINMLKQVGSQVRAGRHRCAALMLHDGQWRGTHSQLPRCSLRPASHICKRGRLGRSHTS